MRQKAEQDDLKFPIIIDNDKSNWNAWGNSMWPSVYLIDKKGYVRYWHYGELDWHDNGGQIIMKQRIEELLKELGQRRSEARVEIRFDA